MSYLISIRSTTIGDFDGTTVLDLANCTVTRDGEIIRVDCAQAVGIVDINALVNEALTVDDLDRVAAEVGALRPFDTLIERIYFAGFITSTPALFSPPTIAVAAGEELVSPLAVVSTPAPSDRLYGVSGRLGITDAGTGQGAFYFPDGYRLGLTTTGGTAGASEVFLTAYPCDGARIPAALCGQLLVVP